MTLYLQKSFLSGLILFCCVIVFNLLPEHGIVFPELINSGHAFVFFFANLFLLNLLFASSASYKQLILISLFSFFIGVVIEIIQPYFGRNRSAIDLYYDLIGILFSSWLYISLNLHAKKNALPIFIVFFCFALAIPSFRLWLWWQINESNTLINFERDWEHYTYSVDQGVTLQTESLGTSGYHAKLSIERSNGYPGFSIDYPKSDWREYKKLLWEIDSNQGEVIKINLRVHDRMHNQKYSDRFNYRFDVKPGLNQFEIPISTIETSPKSRMMEMDRIQNVKFFFSKPKQNISVYIDNIQIE